MTRSFEEALGLPHLDDLLKGEGTIKKTSAPVEEPEDESSVNEKEFEKTMAMAEQKLAMVEGKDHGDAMDEIHKDALKHARDIVDLGFNIDLRGAPRMFEVAAGMYKVALDAKNSKRDAQLKAMKLALDQRALELKEREMGQQPAGVVETSANIVADRNDLIKQLRNQKKDGE